MKQRYISLIFSVVVLFLSAGVLFVYGQNTFEPAPGPFPEGLKDKPVDTGAGGQEKSGNLNLKSLQFGLNSDPTAFDVLLSGKIGNKYNSSALWFSDGALVIDGGGTKGGLALPFSNSDPVAHRAGSIYYNIGDKKVKLFTPDGWTNIGTGSGDSFWTKGTGTEISYDGGDVYIGSVDSIPLKYYPTGNVVTAFNNKKDQYSLLNKASAESAPQGNLLACDVNKSYFDCPVPYTQGGDGTIGTLGYDTGYSCSKYGYDYLLEGDQCVKYYNCTGSDSEPSCVADKKPAGKEYREFVLMRQGASSGKLVAGKVVFSGNNTVRSSEFGYAYNSPSGNSTVTLGEYSFCALSRVLHDGSNGGWCDVYYSGSNWYLNYGKWGSGGVGCRVSCF